MGRRLVLVGTLLVALFGAPRPSDAGLLEIIWEMSGPRMVGTGYGCFFTIRMKAEECRFGTVALERKVKKQIQEQSDPGRTFISLGGSIFASTDHDSKTQGYDWGEVWMLALEPGVAVRNGRLFNAQYYYGAGISYEVLFGRDFKRFDKFAFTITPIDLAWEHVAVGLKIHLYPHGTTDDEFKPGPRTAVKKPFEGTVGATFSLIIPKCNC